MILKVKDVSKYNEWTFFGGFKEFKIWTLPMEKMKEILEEDLKHKEETFNRLSIDIDAHKCFCVRLINRIEPDFTIAFTTEAYLLNNEGKTIEKFVI